MPVCADTAIALPHPNKLPRWAYSQPLEALDTRRVPRSGTASTCNEAISPRPTRSLLCFLRWISRHPRTCEHTHVNLRRTGMIDYDSLEQLPPLSLSLLSPLFTSHSFRRGSWRYRERSGDRQGLEPYSVKRDLLQCQKRPTVSKETYYSVKREGTDKDLSPCPPLKSSLDNFSLLARAGARQKRPIT